MSNPTNLSLPVEPPWIHYGWLSMPTIQARRPNLYAVDAYRNSIGPYHHRLSFSTRNIKMEQNRAPNVLLHQHELASETAHES